MLWLNVRHQRESRQLYDSNSGRHSFPLLLAALLSSGCVLFQHPISPQSSPYPPSALIEGMSFDFSSQVQAGSFPDNSGSDQWPMTWADDGHIYGVWGDGVGWNETSMRYSLGVSRIQATPPGLFGVDVWGANDRNRKPLAIVGDAHHTIYLFHNTDVDNWSGSYGGKSTDNGQTWDLNFPRVFDRDTDGVTLAGIAQFGPGYTNVPSGTDSSYFYVYLKDRAGQAVYLARVPKAEIFNRSAHTYFTGTDSSNNPNWSNDFSTKQPVFFDPAGTEYHINVSYNPGIRRFIYAKGHNKSGLGVFEGTTLWGPWKTIFYGAFLDNNWKFTYQFPQKWMSANGLTMWMAWSGWPEYDNVNFVKVSLLLKNGSPEETPPKPSESPRNP